MKDIRYLLYKNNVFVIVISFRINRYLLNIRMTKILEHRCNFKVTRCNENKISIHRTLYISIYQNLRNTVCKRCLKYFP